MAVRRTEPISRTLLPAVALAAALVAIMATRADPDLWGHLRFGGDILRTHTLPSVDPYSFTSDRPWVNHEWLAEILFALAYRAGGGAALIVLKVLLTGTACALLVGIARAEGARRRELVLIGGLALVAMLPRASQIRPQLLSVVCFAILLATLRAADRGHARRLLWVPALMMIWANMHGGWLVGCATIVCWAAGYVWMRRRDGWLAWIAPAACGALSLAATLATPYGTELWAFLRETIAPSRAFISEWGPITGVPALMGSWILFWMLAAAALLRGGVPTNPALLVIPLVWGVAAARISRLRHILRDVRAGVLRRADPTAARPRPAR